MNKKFFGALTGAAILLSQGSPILAQEMVEVESGSVPGTDVSQATEVVLDDVNFPDDNFRAAVKYAWAGITNTAGVAGGAIDYSNADAQVPNNTKAKLDDLAKITTLSGAATYTSGTLSGDATLTADVNSGKIYPFKNLTGIEYLTGLQTLTILNSPQLKVADLTDNENLTSVTILPLQTVDPSGTPKIPVGPVEVNSIFTNYNVNDTSLVSPTPSANPAPGAAATDPQTAYIESSDLYSLVLPEETGELTTLIVGGANQLTALDLSAYSALDSVALPFNELAQLNVSGCGALQYLNVVGNDLTGLDVSTNSALATLNASGNNLYEVEFPSGRKLKKVNLSHNKLSTIDITPLKGVTTLILTSNRLESIDVSNNDSLTSLDVSLNHLATLDVSECDGLKSVGASSVTSTPQYLYANETDGGIDLASYDENFQASSNGLGWTKNPSAPNPNDVTGGSITKAGVLEFGSNIKPTNSVNTGVSYDYSIGMETAGTTKMTVYVAQADLMNRLYNPNSGEHFYTMDLNEKDTLVKLGWQYEGIGWVAPQENYPTDPVAAGDAVFRLYNPNAGDHHYTADAKEKDVLVRAGWNYEGVGWYSAQPYTYSIRVYREYNPNAKEAGAHNYTTSENENDTLVALGWLDEGTGWWALK